MIEGVDSIKKISVSLNDPIKKIIDCIEESGEIACALLHDESGRFLNIFTDGDIRRSFLHGHTLDSLAADVLDIKLKGRRPLPITASIFSTEAERFNLFKQYNLRQLVLIEGETPKVLIGYKSIAWQPPFLKNSFSALIMAGGFGSRMMPLTANTPKPMLPINGRPMLETIVEKLVKYGVDRITISTHYLPEVICSHFGNGDNFGVPIDYVHESSPLGTGGALKLLTYHPQSLLIINGDVLTDLNIKMFLASHKKNNAVMSIAMTHYSVQVPFGVIEERDSQVISIKEKPTYSFSVNSGIYFINERAFKFLPNCQYFNMTDFAEELIKREEKVDCFPIFERWIDVGRHDDYAYIQKQYPNKL